MREARICRTDGRRRPCFRPRALAWLVAGVTALGCAPASMPPAAPPADVTPPSPVRPAGADAASVAETAPPSPPPMVPADASAPSPEVSAESADATIDAGSTTPPTPPADAAPDTAAPPLGPFPMAALANAKPELVAAVGARVEGPSWRGGDVFFAADGVGLMRADAQGKLYKYHPTLNPVGSFTLADGSVLVCEKKYILLQMFADGKLGVLVGEGAGPTFCNDVTTDGDGNIYFSDPRAGAIMRLTPAGELTRVVSGRRYTNGVDVDRESKYLYFSDTGVNQLFRVALGKDGAAVENLGGMIADGMAFDAWGNLWLAQVSAGVAMVYDLAKKQVIARVGLGGPEATNLAFGGPNNDIIYSTVANKGLYRVPVGVRGFRHPGAAKYAVKAMLDLAPANTPVN